MAELNETPRGNRIHIAFFGLRNAGKSTLINALTGQSLAIVSDVPGTTTDPVSKAMEILPLGPCLITDTAGLDDEGALGELRVEKTLNVLATTDIAIWVSERDGHQLQTEICNQESQAQKTTSDDLKRESIDLKRESIDLKQERCESECYKRFLDACRHRKVTVLTYHRGESVEELKKKIATLRPEDPLPGLLDGLADRGDRVICVTPIDESAPKGRLILPQQQMIRTCLERGLLCAVCQPAELRETLDVFCANDFKQRVLVITDSQAFREVRKILDDFGQASEAHVDLTSFSILFARQKGDLDAFQNGLNAISNLKEDDTVLIAEGCTHHRQCNDIGAVKIPKALTKLTGKKLNFQFTSGTSFPSALTPPPALIVHCGGCMLTRREVLRRIALAQEVNVPITNYGLLLNLLSVKG